MSYGSTSYYDHLPIWLDLEHNRRTKVKNRRFRFEAMKVGETECESIIDHAWGCNYHTESYLAKTLEVVMRKIDVCGNNLEDWNRKEFGHVQYQLNRAKGRLQNILEGDPACLED